jgi:hypothetical protein
VAGSTGLEPATYAYCLPDKHDVYAIEQSSIHLLEETDDKEFGEKRPARSARAIQK